MLNNWFKKERPIQGLMGFGGGATGLLASRSGGGTGSTDPNDYPFDPSYYTLFSSANVWPGSSSDLPTSHAPTTFTVPAQHQGAIRVIGIGAGSGGNTTGKGGYFDIIIPVETGDKFKAIVGQGGATSSSSGKGGNGCGGGCGVDSNDTGSGGGGTAFFYANPDATSDATMFPKGVAIAGGGGGGNSGNDSCVNPTAPDPIGGFNGLWRGGGLHPQGGEPGQVGGQGGRSRHNDGNFRGSRSARGNGGTLHTDGYGGNYGMGNGGGAGAGGGGGFAGPSTSGENAPNGRGWGYGSYNTAGAGRGGDYPMRGGNGFTFNGVNLGGGGGGSHGRAHAGGGWGGGGGAHYDKSGGAGGSGVWGWLEGSTATLNPWSPSNGIPVNGGSVGTVTGAAYNGGEGGGQPGWIVVLW